MRDLDPVLREARDEHHRLVDLFLDRHGHDLVRLADRCAESLAAGGKILLFGNGGSAADAQHLAAEFVNRFDRDRPGLAAIALTTDGSILTSVPNDDEFAAVFARQIEALGRAGDVAVGITTSGHSANVVRALQEAARSGLRTAVLSGRDGGPAAAEAHIALVVPGDETARIQEVHILAGHLLCRLVEDRLDRAVERDPPDDLSRPGS